MLSLTEKTREKSTYSTTLAINQPIGFNIEGANTTLVHLNSSKEMHITFKGSSYKVTSLPCRYPSFGPLPYVPSSPEMMCLTRL